MNNYEMMYICDPSNEDGIEDIKKRIEGIITGHEGQVVSYEKIGKKRLAYPIQKRLYGMYFLVLFQGDGRIIHALDYFLRLNSITIRHLILNMSEKQLRLRDLTEKIQSEEAERMRRGGRPMDSSKKTDSKSVTPEKAADENVSKPASEESPPTEETKKPETESDKQEVVTDSTDTKAVTEVTDVKDSEQDTTVETDKPEAQSNETADKTEPLSDEVEKTNAKTVE